MPQTKVSKEKILNSVLEVFRQQGYYSTTLQELAQACGIQKPHFYYYFPQGKKQLMQEVLQYAYQQLKTFVIDKAYNEAYSPQARLRKMMDNSIQIHAQSFTGCFMANTVLETAGNEETFDDVLKQYFKDWQKAITYLLNTRYESEKAEELALDCLERIQGSIILMRLYKDHSYLENAANKITQYLD